MPGKSGQQPRRGYATLSPQTLLGFLQIRSEDFWGAIKGAPSLRIGQSYWDLAGLGTAHLAGAPIAPAPVAHLQALARSQLCHQADRHRRARRHPSAHPVVLLLRQKSQIQALDRTRPGLPIKPTAGKGPWG